MSLRSSFASSLCLSVSCSMARAGFYAKAGSRISGVASFKGRSHGWVHIG